MAHLLATRYKVEEDFGTQESLEKIDNLEVKIKEKQHSINKKDHDKQDQKKDQKGDSEELKKELGGLKDDYKKLLREMKVKVGTELYNRFMKGFVKTKDNEEENEKITHSEFLFKKLKF